MLWEQPTERPKLAQQAQTATQRLHKDDPRFAWSHHGEEALPPTLRPVEIATAWSKGLLRLRFHRAWLTEKIPDSGIELAGLTLHRADRVTSTSGKLRGGGLAIYTNNSLCCDARMISKSCSPDLEFMTVKCRPFYVPRELAAISITAVYVPQMQM